MAYELRRLDDLEIMARDFEEVAARLRSIAADVRAAGLDEVELQFNYVEKYVLKRMIDWSFSSEAAAKRFIRHKRTELAGESKARRLERDELNSQTSRTQKSRKKNG